MPSVMFYNYPGERTRGSKTPRGRLACIRTLDSCSHFPVELSMNVCIRIASAALVFAFASASAQQLKPIPLRVDPRASVASKRLQRVTMYDSSYQRERTLWIYTPPGYDTHAATPYPLLIAFDGEEYQDTMPLPLVLDTLLAAHKAPAFVAVLMGNSGGAGRNPDLGNAGR